METWVLIGWMAYYRMSGSWTVPDYATRAECEAAAAAMAEGFGRYGQNNWSFCIPGPKRSK